jgi:hypothetical protein
MKSNFTRALTLLLLSASITQIHSLTEETAMIFSATNGAIGVIGGALAGAMTYADPRYGAQEALICLGVGAAFGGFSGLLMYLGLYQYTPKGRIYAASSIISYVSKNKLASPNSFATNEELFLDTTARFHVRWPIAQAHELAIELFDNLSSAAVLLELAARDTQNHLEINEIEKLNSKIEPLAKTLQKHATALQEHPRYEIQATLLEGHRRELRIEEKAEQRHREAMAQQAALHTAAMAQQQALHRPAGAAPLRRR